MMAPAESAAPVVGRARRRRRLVYFFAALGLAAAGMVLLAVGRGAVAIPPARMIAVLAEALPGSGTTAEPLVREVLLNIRLPRVMLGLLTGAALAVAGAALQGLFRNPLADPGLIGVSTGAALAAATMIVLGGALLGSLPAGLSSWLLPIAAFAGGLATTLVVYRIACREGRTDVATMLLAGIALNAIAGAGIGYLVFLSDEQQLRDISFWMLGSLGGVTWSELLPAAVLIILPAAGLALLARPLNAFLLGETEALHLGFAVERAKRRIVVLGALAVGASVALTGVIGFVGLVVPHLVRLMIGPDHRTLIPASILLGGTLVVAADLVARTVVVPAELPIGILASSIGGPFFLWLLLRRHGFGSW